MLYFEMNHFSADHLIMNALVLFIGNTTWRYVNYFSLRYFVYEPIVIMLVCFMRTLLNYKGVVGIARC